MDNLQYFKNSSNETADNSSSFKPYYKWITLNTYEWIWNFRDDKDEF